MNPGQRVKEIDKLYYEDGCHDCGKFNNSASIKFSADVLSSYLKKIYDGFDVSNEIEPTSWREVLRIINEATVEGLSKSEDTHDTAFLNAIKHSNEVFSAFKVHAMSIDMASKLLDENGNLKSYKKWINDVSGLSSHHVGVWLKTEYNTAILRANFAADWKGFERNQDIMPNLRWMPTTSPEPDAMHAKYWLDKLTLPVNDPFWNQHHPGDRWNCKCSLESTSDPVNSSASDNPIISQKGLENNPGKDGHIFSDKHPYFPDNCKRCSFNKNLNNRFKFLFNNQKKDCYNCEFINCKIKR